MQPSTFLDVITLGNDGVYTTNNSYLNKGIEILKNL